MRIKYVGLDNRTRIAEANRIKFMSDGFKPTDRHIEQDDSITGPAIVIHVYRNGGGKRLTLQVPPGYDMEAAKAQALERGWIDLSNCLVKLENLY